MQEMSKPCADNKEIAQVSAISANSDNSIGDIIAEAMEKSDKRASSPSKRALR